ncbi:GNAT family N-acetyltransferase [Microbacterium allomyrinae]|uniref:GNAT family N-acetyltransferase n=1 Tax=Microbacterium allomyrinae TaxID=2830666 RepID=A0A9X1S3Z9_9MICO|nr:GNAT family N-acetyltransferase [Microbacterium allomyrinae]MCC2033042.1 GNAT family N-acetyltransferase [Microbacterium allomyrinae]
MELVELMTARLTLRCPSEADIPRVAEICKDSVIAEFTMVPHPYEIEHARGFVADMVPAGWADGSTLTWGIYERHDPRLLGIVSLSGVSDGIAELGYWIESETRGRGVMTEAAERVVEYAFALVPLGLGLHRLGWEALTTNVASARVAQKLGFAWEGQRRQAAFRLGRTYDLTFAGLLHTDERPATSWPSNE